MCMILVFLSQMLLKLAQKVGWSLSFKENHCTKTMATRKAWVSSLVPFGRLQFQGYTQWLGLKQRQGEQIVVSLGLAFANGNVDMSYAKFSHHQSEGGHTKETPKPSPMVCQGMMVHSHCTRTHKGDRLVQHPAQWAFLIGGPMLCLFTRTWSRKSLRGQMSHLFLRGSDGALKWCLCCSGLSGAMENIEANFSVRLPLPSPGMHIWIFAWCYFAPLLSF